MSKYLTEEQLKSNLNAGKGIEQWLGYYEEDDETILKWVRIYSENTSGYSVMYVECYDQGSLEFLDIYSFTVVNPDEPYGVINTFSSIDEAVAFSIEEHSALRDDFVGDGMIQDEYLNYLNNK